MKDGGAGRKRDRLADQGNGGFVAAGLMRDQAQQMVGGRVPWLCLKDAPVEGFGLLQVPALMKAHGQVQYLSDAPHR